MNNRNGILGAFSVYQCLLSGGPVPVNRKAVTEQLLEAILGAKLTACNRNPSYTNKIHTNGSIGNYFLPGARGGKPKEGSFRFLKALGFIEYRDAGPTNSRLKYFVYDGSGYESIPSDIALVLRVPPKTPSHWWTFQNLHNAARQILFPSSGLETIRGYTMFGASISLWREKSGRNIGHDRHAIAGFMCGGKPYVVDSNGDLDPIPCRWWKRDELSVALVEISAFYQRRYSNNPPGVFHFLRMGPVFYINNEYLKTLSPLSCALRNNIPPPQTYSRSVNNSPRVPNRVFSNLPPARRNKRPPSARGGVRKPVISRKTPNNNNRHRRPGLKIKPRQQQNKNNGTMEE